MTPYVDFLYFGILLYVAIPAVVFGLIGRGKRLWILLATLGMLAVQYQGGQSLVPLAIAPALGVVVGYAVLQYLLALAYLLVRSRTNSRALFFSAVALAIVPLVAARVAPQPGPGYDLGFVGISYLTFRSLDALICIRDKLIVSLPPVQYLAYMLFFPTISSGPIDRYRRFEGDWKRRRTRADFAVDLDGAVHRIFTGFLYKFILAALIKQHWLDPTSAGSDPLTVVSYMYAYTLYLFFDFAGYSQFAVGVSYLLGIHTPDNFDRPFLARNIRDFWNRWHMSLSFWFRDHVYMRFVMLATKGRWFRGRHTASSLGFLLTMGLMGLWHGTAWNYLAYGLYHGSLLVLYDFLGRWNKQHKVWGDGPIWHAAAIAITFQLVAIGMLIFSGRLG